MLIHRDGSPPSEVTKIIAATNKVMAEISQTAAVAAGRAGADAYGRHGDTDRFSATYAVACAATSVLHVLASMLGHHGDASREEVEPNEIAKLINPTSTLLAALLAQAMCPEAVSEGSSDRGAMVGMNIEFGNSVILDAVQQVERITGRPVDGYVHPGMLASVRKTAEGADEPMNRFLAQRRTTPGNLH